MIHHITATQYSSIKKRRAQENRSAKRFGRPPKNDGIILFRIGNNYYMQDDQSFKGAGEVKEFKKTAVSSMKNQSSLL